MISTTLIFVYRCNICLYFLRDRLNIFVSGLTIEKHVSLGKIGEILFIVNVSKLLPVMWIISAHSSSMNSFPLSHSSTNSSRNIRLIRIVTVFVGTCYDTCIYHWFSELTKAKSIFKSLKLTSLWFIMPHLYVIIAYGFYNINEQ